jgi:hypothetical protein
MIFRRIDLPARPSAEAAKRPRRPISAVLISARQNPAGWNQMDMDKAFAYLTPASCAGAQKITQRSTPVVSAAGE